MSPDINGDISGELYAFVTRTKLPTSTGVTAAL